MGEESNAPTESASMADTADCQRLLRWLFHVEAIFNTRTNFFLVAESIGIISFATVSSRQGVGTSASNLLPHDFMTAVVALGIAITIVWGIVQRKTFRLGRRLMDRLLACWPEYGQIKECVDGPSNNKILHLVFPSIFLAFWVVLLFKHLV
jgi:hypothetical protein